MLAAPSERAVHTRRSTCISKVNQAACTYKGRPDALSLRCCILYISKRRNSRSQHTLPRRLLFCVWAVRELSASNLFRGTKGIKEWQKRDRWNYDKKFISIFNGA
ncbi:hypothetical protein L798_12318 [Zootermopsis nevadensis]|uniref:Uncharacterized protein n=1 Tax=Zootermopsis nevadensis TaxID=136037 RepID=A0A067QUC7_ZOONE|nr:hypothetical protein L798_12318 [Zootermopsis nevadensis]